jgi:glutamyl-tRNA synthetase
MAVRVRFAPSPTGSLHIGGARTAIFNWLFARHEGGAFILRIEDTDVERSSKSHEDTILSDLSWLGLDWDEGPDIGGEYAPYRQSERLERYRQTAEDMLTTGRAFRCFCSKDELEKRKQKAIERGQQPHYDGTCRDLDDQTVRSYLDECRPFTIRFKVPSQLIEFDDIVRKNVAFHSSMVGDFVILRSSGLPTYNFAAVVDDLDMSITHVIRAEEHLPNTLRQLMIYQAMDAEPPRFAHVSLIRGEGGEKLSKRTGAASLEDYRQGGYLPEAIFNYLCLLGWSPEGDEEVKTRQELIDEFELDQVSPSPAILDARKLAWINGVYLRALSPEEFAGLARPYLIKAGMDEDDPREPRIAKAFKKKIDTLSDLVEQSEFLFDDSFPYETDAAEFIAEQRSQELLRAVLELFDRIQPTDSSYFMTVLKTVGKKLGLKGKNLLMPVRVALTGKTHGPDLSEVVDIHGTEKVRMLLERALSSEGPAPMKEGD